MKRLLFWLAALLPLAARADDAQLTDGQLAIGLSTELLCDTYNLVSGNIGLILGFLLAVWGLVQIVRSNDFKKGVVFLVCGALLTALPGLIIATLKGAAVAVNQTGLTAKTSLMTPSCSGNTGPWAATNGEKQ